MRARFPPPPSSGRVFRTLARRRFILLAALAAGVAGYAQTPSPAKGDLLVYLGTYTGQKSKGIYVSRFDPASGTLSAPALAAEASNPSFLAIHPSRDLLYAVNEVNTSEGKPGGSVAAFAIDRGTGKLTLLGQQTSGGAGPAHVSVDRNGQNVLVANYGGGSVEVLPIGTNGGLRAPSSFIQHTGSSVNPDRQKGPHAHSIDVDPANRFAYVSDLGLDKILIYRFDPARGRLAANTPPSAPVKPGAGPRHFAIHPKGRLAYVINEIDCTITGFIVDPTSGSLSPIDTVSTLPSGQAVQKGYSTAEIAVHPSGRFLYGSNRGHDSVVVFRIDETSGRLTHVQHQATGGKTPRNFGIDPTGAYLLAANQGSDSVVVFRIDQQTGRLTPTGQTIEVGAPVCVTFLGRR